MSRKDLAGLIGASVVAIITLVVVAVMAMSGEPPPTPPADQDTGLISEEVSWAIGETTVNATITRPDGEGPYPAVVFIARTGATDRNWNAPYLPGSNGSGRLLAAELARHDFVTIRHDWRYAGPGAAANLPHLAGNISLAGHADEIAGAIETLLTQDYVDPGRIYLLSHGEGALPALNYTVDYGENISGLVVTEPPPRPLTELFMEQVRAQFRDAPGGDEIIAGCEALIADFLAGEPFVAHPDLPAELNNYIGNLHDPRSLPFMREVLPLDAAELLAQTTVSTLVVIGKKDIQINWETDGALLQAATAGLDHITYQFPENADHVLKYQPKPREELTSADALQYNAAGRTLDSGAVQVILDWLMQESRSG
ncbi:MAG: alpha/beta hydrolase family protein [Dehalococcoidia bacterium]